VIPLPIHYELKATARGSLMVSRLKIWTFTILIQNRQTPCLVQLGVTDLQPKLPA
jgi:hypothetical protein